MAANKVRRRRIVVELDLRGPGPNPDRDGWIEALQMRRNNPDDLRRELRRRLGR